MTKKSLKRIFSCLFLVAVFTLTAWAVFAGEDLSRMAVYLCDADGWYILLSVVCVVLFILGESLVIHYLMHTLGQRHNVLHCCLYSFIGFFYSCITPSASGGQPMQVVAMRKDKIPVAVSTIVLVIVTVTYKLVLVVVGSVVLLIRPPQVMQYLDGAEPILYLGLVLNVAFISALLLMIFKPGLVRICGEKVIALCNRIRPFRHPQKQTERLQRLMHQYEGTADFYRNHKCVILNVFVITLVQRILLFTVTWLTYRAFRLSGESAGLIVTLQAMISVASDMMPLPGGTGVSESLFLMIFCPIFGEDLTLPAMVISRGISYYAQLVLSAAVTAVAAFVIKERTHD